jgi:drug/metabolite transporter (DMT)-like permease
MTYLILQYLSVILIYGISPIINKYVLAHIKPESFMVIGGVVSVISAIIFSFIRKNKLILDIANMNKHKHVYLLIFLSSFILSIIVNYNYLELLNVEPAYRVTSVTSCYPLITAILGYLFLSEQVSIKHLTGVFFIMTGVCMLS